VNVDKFATHLENTGVKSNGIYAMAPVTSFFVKDFKDNVLVLSGYSISNSLNGSAQSPESNAKVSSHLCLLSPMKCPYN
jgi:hypothetical protein